MQNMENLCRNLKKFKNRHVTTEKNIKRKWQETCRQRENYKVGLNLPNLIYFKLHDYIILLSDKIYYLLDSCNIMIQHYNFNILTNMFIMKLYYISHFSII